MAQIGIISKQYAMKKCGAIAPGAFNSICINLARSAICLVVSLAIWLIADGSATTPLGLIISIGAGVGTALNLFSWILSTQRISLTLIEGVCTIGSLVIPLLLAPYLYNGESVSAIQWLGCALLIASILLFSGKDSKAKEKKSLIGNISLLFVCALGVTMASVSKKLYSFHISSKGLGSIDFFTLISFVTVICIFSILFIIYQGSMRRKTASQGDDNKKITDEAFGCKKVWFFILIAAISLYVVELFSTYASNLPSVIYYPASRALGILGSFFLDVAIFKEKITPSKIISLFLLLVAIVLINI